MASRGRWLGEGALVSDREIRALERLAAADPSDEAAVEAARAARWRAGRPTAADRLAAILADPEVRSAHYSVVWPGPPLSEAAEVAALAEPFVRGACPWDRAEVASGLSLALGWREAPGDRGGVAGAVAAYWTRKAEGA